MGDLSGTTLRDRYRVIRRIGRGAMSDVYLAEHRQHAEVKFLILGLLGAVAYIVRRALFNLAYNASSTGHRARADLLKPEAGSSEPTDNGQDTKKTCIGTPSGAPVDIRLELPWRAPPGGSMPRSERGIGGPVL